MPLEPSVWWSSARFTSHSEVRYTTSNATAVHESECYESNTVVRAMAQFGDVTKGKFPLP